MTDTKALIAEARRRVLDLSDVNDWRNAGLIDRLADALERASDGLTSVSCPTRPD